MVKVRSFGDNEAEGFLAWLWTKAKSSPVTMTMAKCFLVTPVKTKGSPRTIRKDKGDASEGLSKDVTKAEDDDDEDRGLSQNTDDGR